MMTSFNNNSLNEVEDYASTPDIDYIFNLSLDSHGTKGSGHHRNNVSIVSDIREFTYPEHFRILSVEEQLGELESLGNLKSVLLSCLQSIEFDETAILRQMRHPTQSYYFDNPEHFGVSLLYSLDKWYLTRNLKLRTELSYVKDLTEEGIEPNPGPDIYHIILFVFAVVNGILANLYPYIYGMYLFSFLSVLISYYSWSNLISAIYPFRQLVLQNMVRNEDTWNLFKYSLQSNLFYTKKIILEALSSKTSEEIEIIDFSLLDEPHLLSLINSYLLTSASNGSISNFKLHKVKFKCIKDFKTEDVINKNVGISVLSDPKMIRPIMFYEKDSKFVAACATSIYYYANAQFQKQLLENYPPPPPRLVGIEPNPGPGCDGSIKPTFAEVTKRTQTNVVRCGTLSDKLADKVLCEQFAKSKVDSILHRRPMKKYFTYKGIRTSALSVKNIVDCRAAVLKELKLSVNQSQREVVQLRCRKWLDRKSQLLHVFQNPEVKRLIDVIFKDSPDYESFYNKFVECENLLSFYATAAERGSLPKDVITLLEKIACTDYKPQMFGASEMIQSVKDLTNSFNKVANNGIDVNLKIPLIDSFGEWIKSVPISVWSSIGGLIIGLMGYITNSLALELIGGILLIYSAWNNEYLSEHVTTTYDSIKKFVSYYNEERMVTQSSTSELKQLIIKPVMGLIFMLQFKDATPAQKENGILHFVKTSSTMKKMEGGLGWLIDYIFDICSSFSNFLRNNGWDLDIFPLDSHKTQIRELSMIMNNIIDEMNAGGGLDFNRANRVFLVEMSLRGLKQDLGVCGINDKELYNYVNELGKSFASVVQAAKSMNPNSGGGSGRNTPLGVIFGGPSQVGKSAITNTIVIEVAIRSCANKKEAEFFRKYIKFMMYVRLSDQQFWSGYFGQPFIKFDEAFQLKADQEGALQLVWDIFKVCNNQTFLTDQAELVFKGQIPAEPWVVFFTTNRINNLTGYLKQMIHEPIAILNRLNLKFGVTLKGEYLVNPTEAIEKHIVNREAVKGKCQAYVRPDGTAGLEYSTDIYRFCFLDYDTGRPTTEFFDYNVAVQIICEYMRKNRGQGEDMQKLMDSVIERSFVETFQGDSETPSGVIYGKQCQDEVALKYLPPPPKEDQVEFRVVENRKEKFNRIKRESKRYGKGVGKPQGVGDILKSTLGWFKKPDPDIETFVTADFEPDIDDEIENMLKERETLNNSMSNFKKLFSSLKQNLVPLTILVSIGVFAGVASIIWKSVFASSPEWVAQMSGEVKRGKKPKVSSIKAHLMAKSGKGAIVTSNALGKTQVMSNRSNYVDIANAVENHGSWLFGIKDFDILGEVNALTETYILMNRHFVDRLLGYYHREAEEKDFEFYIKKPFSDQQINFMFSDIYKSDRAEPFPTIALISPDSEDTCCDLCIWDVGPYKFPACKDSLKYIISRDELSTLADHRFGMTIRYISAEKGVCITNSVLVLAVSDAGHYEDNDKEVTYAGNGFSYEVACHEGMCGARLFRTDTAYGPGKWIGIHSAGTHKTGFGVSLVKEDIILAIDDLKARRSQHMLYGRYGELQPILEDDSMDLTIKEELVEPEDFNGMRQLCHCKAGPILSTHEKIKSVLHGRVCKPLKALTKLTPFLDSQGEVIDPLVKNTAGCGLVEPAYNETLMNDALDSYFRIIEQRSHTPAEFRRLLTLDEAILGIDGECMSSLSRKTSAGKEWKDSCPSIPSSAIKKKIFGEEGGKVNQQSELWSKFSEKYNKQLEHMKSGKRIEHVSEICLKDERVSLEKSEIGKTRPFLIESLNRVLMSRQAYGGFSMWCNDNRIYNGMTIGINPYGSEWQLLYNYLQNLGVSKSRLKYLFGDFSRWDQSVFMSILRKIAERVDHWYCVEPGADSYFRFCLIEDISNTRVVLNVPNYEMRVDSDTGKKYIVITGANGIVVEWIGGMPSGCFLTALFNSIVNQVILRYAIIDSLCEDEQVVYDHSMIEMFDTLETNCRIVTNGDDNGISLVLDVIPLQVPSFLKSLKKIGFNMTSEDKKSELIFKDDMSDSTYLKRAFRFEPVLNRHVAPLSLETIYDMQCWRKKTSTEEEFCQTIRTSLLELSFHGKDKWFQLAPKMIEEIDKAGYGHAIPSRDWKTALLEASRIKYAFTI